MTTYADTVSGTLAHTLGVNTFARNFMFSLVASLAIWVSAKIQIPFFPVPLTLQTFVILTLGMILGWRWGTFTVFLYLLEGVMGLPVFAGTPAKGIGVAYMVGPTGGYLIGFLLAVMVVGLLAEKGRWDRHPVLTLSAMVIGNLIIYVSGVLWLGNLLGWDKPIMEWAVYPFLLGDVLKIILAALLLPFFWKLVPKN